MQKTILSLLLCSALVAPALAKKVSDRTHTFSFEAPDDWRFVAPSGSAARVPNTILLARSDKKQMVGVRGIKSYRKTQPDLDQWADLTAALFSTVTHRPTAVMEWKADNEPARLMDGLFGNMMQSTALITQKNGCAALMFVISENGDSSHIPKCKELFGSFHWEANP